MKEILINQLPAFEGYIGEIILNRPQALNALTISMCSAIRTALLQWEKDEDIKAVLIRSNDSRAFCAGGDIRSIYSQGLKEPELAKAFFREEYSMNKALFHFPKPYIALLNGITMGGGAGISVHGTYRIATENLLFAMPETGIGFFPDVGGGYFLNQIPHYLGYYLGLSGTRLKTADAQYLGVITHVMPAALQSDFMAALCNCNFNQQSVVEIIETFATPPEKSDLAHDAAWLQHCFSASSVEKICLLLEKTQTAKSESVLNTLLSKAPLSLKVTLEHLKRSKKLAFDAIMQMEFNITLQFIKTPDFYEGVRAVIIDKDQKPHWQPTDLGHVTQEMVDRFFMGANIL